VLRLSMVYQLYELHIGYNADTTLLRLQAQH